jgi:hypothetical protein
MTTKQEIAEALRGLDFGVCGCGRVYGEVSAVCSESETCARCEPHAHNAPQEVAASLGDPLEQVLRDLLILGEELGVLRVKGTTSDQRGAAYEAIHEAWAVPE